MSKNPTVGTPTGELEGLLNLLDNELTTAGSLARSLQGALIPVSEESEVLDKDAGNDDGTVSAGSPVNRQVRDAIYAVRNLQRLLKQTTESLRI